MAPGYRNSRRSLIGISSRLAQPARRPRGSLGQPPTEVNTARIVVHGQEVDIAQVVAQVGDSDARGTIVDFNDPRGDRIEVSVE
jgi:hypothetical protein